MKFWFIISFMDWNDMFIQCTFLKTAIATRFTLECILSFMKYLIMIIYLWQVDHKLVKDCLNMILSLILKSLPYFLTYFIVFVCEVALKWNVIFVGSCRPWKPSRGIIFMPQKVFVLSSTNCFESLLKWWVIFSTQVKFCN